jgi:hypothetical protein
LWAAASLENAGNRHLLGRRVGCSSDSSGLVWTRAPHAEKGGRYRHDGKGASR